MAHLFIKDIDQYEGFVLVAFEPVTSAPTIYQACRNDHVALASVNLNHKYALDMGLSK